MESVGWSLRTPDSGMSREGGALARNLSIALAAIASVNAGLCFAWFEVFKRDAPSAVGNMRGTALTMLALALPLLVLSVIMAERGSARARFVWLGSLAYLTYNSALMVFAIHFNSFFLLNVATLSLSLWSLVALVRNFDAADVVSHCARVPVRLVAIYMLACTGLFAFVWLRDIVPAMIANVMPSSFGSTGWLVSPTHVLDFAFTFPLLVAGALRIWRRRSSGYVLGGGLLVMLTIETLSIAVDQIFGHRHDPTQSLGAVPLMIALTSAGVAMCFLFLRRVEVRSRVAINSAPAVAAGHAVRCGGRGRVPCGPAPRV